MLAAWPGLMEGFQGVSTATRPARAAGTFRPRLLRSTWISATLPRRPASPPLTSPAALTARSTSWKVHGQESRSSISITTDCRTCSWSIAPRFDGKGPGEKSTSHLYRNLGKLRFEDVTARIRPPGAPGGDKGACVGDYDNDGLPDLFVTYYGHSVLYHNEGGGVFRDVTKEAGLSSDAVRWDTGAARSSITISTGKLDLVFTDYLEFDRNAAFRNRGQQQLRVERHAGVLWFREVCRPAEGISCFTTKGAAGSRMYRRAANLASRREVLRLHRHGFGFRQRRLPGSVCRHLRFPAQPALPQPARPELSKRSALSQARR